jgi:hypothetical protein
MIGETQFFSLRRSRLRWTLVAPTCLASTCLPLRTACAAEIETFDGSLSYSGRYRGLPWGCQMSRKDGRQVPARENHQISLLAVDSINVNTLSYLMGWTKKKAETLACGQDGRRTVIVAIASGLEPEMEMNKPLLHSEITLLYTCEKTRSAIMKMGRSEAQRGKITTRPGRLMEDLPSMPSRLSTYRYPGSSCMRYGRKYLAQRYITLLYGMPEYNKMRKLARTRGRKQERSNKRARTKSRNLPADDATRECANK